MELKSLRKTNHKQGKVFLKLYKKLNEHYKLRQMGLLEKGIDIRFIKDLLGHFDIRTTERYTHVRKDTLINITSPLDDLWLKGDIL